MRILTIHNYYQQPGGEDVVFEAEARLLERYGHEVVREEFRNETISEDRSLFESGQLAISTIWSRSAEQRIRAVIQDVQPDIAHFHNTFPLVSPAGYAACRKVGVPVVQTLHNYRAICSKAQFFRDGAVCEDCLGRLATWPGILHGCYRDSRPMSATVSAMQLFSRLRGTWHSDIDMFIAINRVVRDKYVQGGFPEEAIAVKPHFVDPDPGPGEHRGNFAVYVGRLSPEKGVTSLLQAWESAPGQMPLKIIGDGKLAGDVATAAERNPLIEWLGSQPLDRVVEIIGDAAFLVFPSIWQEPFGRTIIEAYARGTPVVASALGASLELVVPGKTGLHFEAGNPHDLARSVSEVARDPQRLEAMGREARSVFKAEYTADRNYRELLQIYQTAMARSESLNRRGRSHPAW